MNLRDLVLSVVPRHREVLVGESIDVKVELTNRGAVPVEVPDTLSPSTFEFIFRAPGTRQVLRILSASEARLARRPEPVPVPQRKKSLSAGDKAEYLEDLANYAVKPLAAGTYHLSVAYSTSTGRSESEATPITIAVPNPSLLALTSSTTRGNLAGVFSHLSAAGEAVLLQRESQPDKPNDGIAYRRIEFAKSSDLAAAAIATTIESDRHGRWMAWMQNSAIGAIVAQEKTAFVHIDPIPIGLQAASLQSTGWQQDAESATFAVLGVNAQNRLAIALAAFKADGERQVKTVDLGREKRDFPAYWGAQLRLGEQTPGFDLITAEVSGGRVLVRTQSVSAGNEPVRAPATLAEHAGAVAAFAVNPLVRGAVGVVDILYRLDNDNADMVLQRLGLESRALVGQWQFPAPRGQDGRPPSQWALAPVPVADPVILAKLGDRLLVRRAQGSAQWSTLATESASADHLRLIVMKGESVWAVWSDPARGIQYQRVP